MVLRQWCSRSRILRFDLCWSWWWGGLKDGWLLSFGALITDILLECNVGSTFRAVVRDALAMAEDVGAYETNDGRA